MLSIFCKNFLWGVVLLKFLCYNVPQCLGSTDEFSTAILAHLFRPAIVDKPST